MDTAKLKRFAQDARRMLMEQVETKLKTVLSEDSLARRESKDAVKSLEDEIKKTSSNRVVQRVAYVWFNRLCAFRYMDVNRFTKVLVVSPQEGYTQPEILAEAKAGHVHDDLLPLVNKDRLMGLLSGNVQSNEPQQEAYRMLLVASCNQYHKLMPFLFEKIEDYSELLLPDDLLSENSIVALTREALSPENCEDIEVIGWLYQFYISEKKDAVFADLKKNKKITPENIPAATQLFTPHWIVRYMVENSLGRLWLLNHPDSRLIDKMEYYIKPEQEETDFLKINSPEEIKLCDPACGSGHILVYAFDLLYSIYEEQGYDTKEIPALILKNNLFGIELDERAGELAAFALVMKAREKYRRFLNNPVQPNICVMQKVEFDEEDLESYMQRVGRDLFTVNLEETLKQFKDADNFGSLIRPSETDVTSVLKLLESKGVEGNLFLASTHENVLKILRMVEYLSPRYHVVVANPPYMGGKGMNAELGKFAKENYPDSKSDLFAMFIERIMPMVLDGGVIGLMTPFTWMFISSYEKIRIHIQNEYTLTSLVRPEYHAFFESAYVPICSFTLFHNMLPTYKGAFIDLNAFYGAELQSIKTLEAIRNPSCNWFFRASTADFVKIPGGPIAYWVSNKVREVFNECKYLGEIAEPRQGLATGNNDRFVRCWSEISHISIGFGFASGTIAKESSFKWFPYNKGGEFRKWYGNLEFVVNWEKDGFEIRNLYDEKGKLRSRPQNTQYYFRSSITWTLLSSSYFGVRYMPEGAIFDINGMSCFSDSLADKLLGLMSSKLCAKFLEILNPTLAFQVGDIKRIPVLVLENIPCEYIIQNLINYAKQDWDSYENSWDFSQLPLITIGNEEAKAGSKEKATLHFPLSTKLNEAYKKLRVQWKNKTLEVRRLEEKNNHIFIEAYGLQNELTPEVPLKEITLTCNPYYRYGDDKTPEQLEGLLLQDTMKEFISYSVGCMFGRYSLDKPGLILANQGETLEDYVRKVCSGECVVGSEDGGGRKVCSGECVVGSEDEGGEKVDSGEWGVGSKEKNQTATNYSLSTTQYPKDGGKNGKGEKLPGTDCVAKSNGSGRTGLSGNQGISERRTLRVDKSGQALCGVDSFKHSGRAGEKIDGGISEFLINCERFKSRDGDPNTACPALELCNEQYNTTNSDSLGGSQPSAEWTDEQSQITIHCPLSTIHFLPDEDNVIPLMDSEWFEDDIVERFKKFLKVTFGEEHYEENLRFIEEALGYKTSGKSKLLPIRDYFLNSFYNDHIKTYKKRPIYWMFSSPKGTFNALIYMHRYRPDTVSRVLNEYLRVFRKKLAAFRDNKMEESISKDASAGQKTSALKEIEKLNKQIAEIDDYERDILYPLANENIRIDLDDGVKRNYALFGKALKLIPGLNK